MLTGRDSAILLLDEVEELIDNVYDNMCRLDLPGGADEIYLMRVLFVFARKILEMEKVTEDA